MTIEVRIIADSVSYSSDRLTTFLIKYPRIVHSEFLRDRRFSHSVSSSRAVPIMRMLLNTVRDAAEPFEWGSNKPGMQAGESLTGARLFFTKFAWHGAKWCAVVAAWIAHKAGAHKQIANRIIEPWTHTEQVVTATNYQGFFDLRCHDAADPTIRELAERMKLAYMSSSVVVLKSGEWHLPFISREERLNFVPEQLAKASAARCARASYLNHDRSNPIIETDLILADKLIAMRHWSPFEHQGTPKRGCKSGNFVGFIQNRKLLENG